MDYFVPFSWKVFVSLILLHSFDAKFQRKICSDYLRELMECGDFDRLSKIINLLSLLINAGKKNSCTSHPDYYNCNFNGEKILMGRPEISWSCRFWHCHVCSWDRQRLWWGRNPGLLCRCVVHILYVITNLNHFKDPFWNNFSLLSQCQAVYILSRVSMDKCYDVMTNDVIPALVKLMSESDSFYHLGVAVMFPVLVKISIFLNLNAFLTRNAI